MDSTKSLFRIMDGTNSGVEDWKTLSNTLPTFKLSLEKNNLRIFSDHVQNTLRTSFADATFKKEPSNLSVVKPRN